MTSATNDQAVFALSCGTGRTRLVGFEARRRRPRTPSVLRCSSLQGTPTEQRVLEQPDQTSPAGPVGSLCGGRGLAPPLLGTIRHIRGNVEVYP
jgi:hypothetical protein